MAVTPLNTFKTFTTTLTTIGSSAYGQLLYTAPTGFTSIILMAQISNITSSAAQATFSYYNIATATAASTTPTNISLIQGFSVPGNDSVSVTSGKLVVMTGDQVYAYASANSTLQIVLSILETSNG